MLRQAPLIPLLLLLPLSSSALTQAQPGSGLGVEVVSRGLQLTLSVPRRVYPKNAVVRTTVTVKNVARSLLVLFHQFCGRQHVDENPRVLVQALPGQTIAYPKALLGPMYHCPPPPPPDQAPGAIAALPRLLPCHVLRRHLDVIKNGMSWSAGWIIPWPRLIMSRRNRHRDRSSGMEVEVPMDDLPLQRIPG